MGDLDLPGAVHLTFVRSTVAHARLASLDVEGTRAADGVRGVYLNADLGVAPLPPGMPMLNQDMTRPVLAEGVVRFVGEPIVVIAADTPTEGADAAELVVIDYDPLPLVVDPEEALKDEALLYPEIGTNTCFALQFGHDETLFDGCDVVVRQKMINQRVAPCPLEGRSSAAEVAADGRLTFYASTQTAHGVRNSLAQALAVDPDQVHVISPDVGGGFGAKGSVYPEDVAVAWVARHLGRPARWTETRSESMLGLGHGRAQVQEVEIGGTPDGRILATASTCCRTPAPTPISAPFCRS